MKCDLWKHKVTRGRKLRRCKYAKFKGKGRMTWSKDQDPRVWRTKPWIIIFWWNI
jgi:hypothetical protein